MTVSAAVRDQFGAGHVDEPLIDAANISPGYIVSSPDVYSQVFMVPAVPDDGHEVIVSFRYEMLLLRPKSNPRDFAKLTVTDRVIIGPQ